MTPKRMRKMMMKRRVMKMRKRPMRMRGLKRETSPPRRPVRMTLSKSEY
jgi:hypothetical protein